VGSSSRPPWSVARRMDAPASAASPAPASLERQVEVAIARVEAQAESGRKLLNEVNAQFRTIPNVKLTAEAAVGAVLGSSTVGNLVVGAGVSLVTWNKEMLARAVKDAEKAGEMMFGKLTDTAARASVQHLTFKDQYAAFSATNRQLQQAMRAGDHRGIVELTKRMESQDAAMRATAAQFGATAKAVQKLDAEFNQAAVHAVEELLAKAVLLGIGGVPGEHAIEGVAKRLIGETGGELVGSLYGATVESAGMKILSELKHLSHARTAPRH